MSSGEGSLLQTDAGQPRGDYSAGRPSRPPRHRHESRRPRKAVRRFYFALTSLWGFVVGAFAIAASDRLEPTSRGLTLLRAGSVGAGLVLAIAGSFLAAAAYRNARSRASR